MWNLELQTNYKQNIFNGELEGVDLRGSPEFGQLLVHVCRVIVLFILSCMFIFVKVCTYVAIPALEANLNFILWILPYYRPETHKITCSIMRQINEA